MALFGKRKEKPKATSCRGSCDCESRASKTVFIEYLFLDLKTCDRCIGTDAELVETLNTLTPALTLAGYPVEYRKIEMATREIAISHRFLSSPTIRVNGRDICTAIAESDCGCCGEISGTQVDCRVFEYGGKTFEVPPKQMLAERILSAVFGNSTEPQPTSDYLLPENLKSFYDGKQKKSGCGCGTSCCG